MRIARMVGIMVLLARIASPALAETSPPGVTAGATGLADRLARTAHAEAARERTAIASLRALATAAQVIESSAAPTADDVELLRRRAATCNRAMELLNTYPSVQESWATLRDGALVELLIAANRDPAP